MKVNDNIHMNNGCYHVFVQDKDLHHLLFQVTNEIEVQSEEEEQTAIHIQTITYRARLVEIFQNFKNTVIIVLLEWKTHYPLLLTEITIKFLIQLMWIWLLTQVYQIVLAILPVLVMIQKLMVQVVNHQIKKQKQEEQVVRNYQEQQSLRVSRELEIDQLSILNDL
ncbi:hypothetical protein PfdVgp3 [Periplaneta fuliginosa densovirus]|uniref:Uncharacterized protein n=2 Tax=Pefuambidensovirus blattodean1 TaxID=3052603 RepID=Q77NU9_PFDNG|nr:hypothetical protein PfdVgp3 [Periplaneta fuliginosa densovirus]AAF04302.1 unknown [Periplaneta fuliginosa densovirus]BAA82964.1 ORF-3 [Periplaneta fuliginosa densovirus]